MGRLRRSTPCSRRTLSRPQRPHHRRRSPRIQRPNFQSHTPTSPRPQPEPSALVHNMQRPVRAQICRSRRQQGSVNRRKMVVWMRDLSVWRLRSRGLETLILREVRRGKPPNFLRGKPLFTSRGTPILGNVGETPKESMGEETPVDAGVQKPVGGGQRIVVDLVDDQEEEDPPVDKRAEWRRARRILLDEVEDLAQIEGMDVPAPGEEGEQEETPGSDGEEDEAEKRRLAKDRKRKGKQAAPLQPKKSWRVPPVKDVEEPILPPTKVPFAKERVGPTPESESEFKEEKEQEEELNYEQTEVRVTKGVLEAMKRFDNQKRATTYKERSSAGKLAKSGICGRLTLTKNYVPTSVL